MLGSYATHDHRAKVEEEKKACIELPRLPSGNGGCGVHGTGIRHLRGPLSRKGCCAMRFSFRKEVIQPQVLLRLPCYDFTPIMNYTLYGCLLAVG